MTNGPERAKGRHLILIPPLESIFMRNCLIHLHHHQNRKRNRFGGQDGRGSVWRRYRATTWSTWTLLVSVRRHYSSGKDAYRLIWICIPWDAYCECLWQPFLNYVVMTIHSLLLVRGVFPTSRVCNPSTLGHKTLYGPASLAYYSNGKYTGNWGLKEYFSQVNVVTL